MTTSASVHRLQIERVVNRYVGVTAASFGTLGGRHLCTAINDEGVKRIRTGSNVSYGIEEASALSIALTMAIDWLAEQP